jgi:hypothetical protein
MIEILFWDDRPPVTIYTNASVELPPPEFDHEYPNMIVEFAPAGEVAQRCRGAAVACAWLKPDFKNDSCFVLLPTVGRSGVSARTQELRRRREQGHCNGWEHKR